MKKPYIICEIGQAHDGSLGFAHSFIDALKDCNIDAIKFQLILHLLKVVNMKKI